MVSAKVEDYLKTIFRHQADDAAVEPSTIASAMCVKPSTVTTMLQRMADDGFVCYERYHGATLTENGETHALKVLRHHRLLELFLTEALDYDWSEVHEEAEVLEHYVSEKFALRLDERLGDPTVDPHGTPIPTADLELRREVPVQPLNQCLVGEAGTVAEVHETRDGLLRHLSDSGVHLGTRLEVTEVAPFGMFTVEIRDSEQQLSLPADTAAHVFLSRPDGTTDSEIEQLSEV